jgi:hypothetical protein
MEVRLIERSARRRAGDATVGDDDVRDAEGSELAGGQRFESGRGNDECVVPCGSRWRAHDGIYTTDQERFVRRQAVWFSFVIMAAMACASSRLDRVSSRALGDRLPQNKAGIAVVASGGIAGWEHVTLLDSATARYVTVTRRACSSVCAPLDSATGTLAASDVARIYEIADSERVLLGRLRPAACEGCADDALVTTAVFGNRRRTVIRSEREMSPEVHGRVHVALAEAIRATRAAAIANER